MENNIENIWVKAKVYTNQTSIFIVNCIKMQKTSALLTNKEAPTVLCSVVKHAGSG